LHAPHLHAGVRCFSAKPLLRSVVARPDPWMLPQGHARACMLALCDGLAVPACMKHSLHPYLFSPFMTGLSLSCHLSFPSPPWPRQATHLRRWPPDGPVASCGWPASADVRPRALDRRIPVRMCDMIECHACMHACSRHIPGSSRPMICCRQCTLECLQGR